MTEELDWRLLNDVEQLKKAALNPTDGEELFRHLPRLNHCIFCFAPVRNSPHQRWFIPLDLSCCICETCCSDFQEAFEWRKLDGWDIDWE